MKAWIQLMLALYRSGMRPPALAAYLEAHNALRNASGIDPGPSMRLLHKQILHDVPSLLRP
jgi:DNA-binding SARP family transcriptional activator